MTPHSRSLALGILVGIFATLGIGAARTEPLKTGRFKLTKTTNNRASVIDTATGQVWYEGHRGEDRDRFYGQKLGVSGP